MIADLTGISDADGVVVDDDGTVYFLTDDSVHSYVGRIPPGGEPFIQWLRIVDSPTTWGLALDRRRKRIYVAVVSGVGAIVMFEEITGTPRGRQLVTGIAEPNDVVVAEDGTVYYSNQADRNIYSVSVDGQGPRLATTTPLGNAAAEQEPAGLAFAADGSLVVGLSRGGRLHRIILAGGREVSRDFFGAWAGWANGLAFDRSGRLYISIYDDTAPRSVVRLEKDGTGIPTTILPGGRFSSLAFGRGPLDCRDLYVADPFGPMQRVRVADAD
jgi:sugar lactone lactonase YvrE